jgi:alpha-galactosidase
MKNIQYSIKRIIILSFLTCSIFIKALAQEMPLDKGWKFSLGDSAQWASANYNDQNWKAINIDRNWKLAGYPGVSGFGWYRLHLIIPSSLKEKSFLKDSVRIDLGLVSDNDEVYLNGTLIAKYGGKTGDIRHPDFGPRSYVITANNPAILWDNENVLAVRIFNKSGGGGMYGTNFKISIPDLLDNVTFDTNADFTFDHEKILCKSVKLVTTSTIAFQGKVSIKVTSPESNRMIYEKIYNAHFTAQQAFTFAYHIRLLNKESYQATYTFTEERSGRSITRMEATPYLLTPMPVAQPRINGPDVYGARPGNPFLYLIPVTGRRPITYRAAGLPNGLKLDANTGIISGVTSQKGNYPVIITVSNSHGRVSKTLTICISDRIGLTPALGWNSWNAFGLTVDDEKVRTAAKTMISHLSQHGWNYVNIDDGWEASQRTANGEITSNQKFSDMKGLTDYVHSLGLKMGIYSSPGPRTCGGYLASYQHEDQDAQTYGGWGFDYLKYDWCSYSEVAPKVLVLADYQQPYRVMRASLDKVPRDIMFSFCQYGMGDVWTWAAEVGGNSWRTTGDIKDTWKSMSAIGFNQIVNGTYAGPGHFNDPDMLVVGKVGWGRGQHNTRLTPDEQYTHISLWSLLSAPLLIGCDMGKLDQFTLNLLTNDEVLAIDQDALGEAAKQVIKTDIYQVWIKNLSDGSKAVGIFNLSDEYQTITLNTNENGLNGFTKTRDVWQQKTWPNTGANLTKKIAPHGVMLVRLSKS